MTLQSGDPQVFQIVHPTVTAVQCRGSFQRNALGIRFVLKSGLAQDENKKATVFVILRSVATKNP